MILLKQIKEFPKYFWNILPRVTGYFFAYIQYPKRARQCHTHRENIVTNSTVAVVMQGPLMHEHDFTLETLKLYKKTLQPETMVIVSTWDSEDSIKIEKIKELGFYVVQSKKPEQAGISNINMQIVSTREGIKKAQELGVTHILKTRTDIRMYEVHIEAFLCSLLTTFPPAPNFDQNARIVGFSINTFYYRPYSISDLSLFSTTEEMLKYWDVLLDTRTSYEDNTSTLGDWSRARLCEVYLSAHYLEKIGRKLHWTLADSLQAYSEHFCVVDNNTVGMYWHKYKHWKTDRRDILTRNKNDKELSFKEWFILFNGLKKVTPDDEEILKKEIGAYMS